LFFSSVLTSSSKKRTLCNRSLRVNTQSVVTQMYTQVSMPNQRIPSFNPSDYVVIKPRLDRDVCMLHHSIRKPKCELISIDEPGALNEHHHLRLEYLQLWYSSRTKILKRDFLYQRPLTTRHNPSSANMAPNTNIDLYTAGSTSMP
jgi:hypothetical protein